MFDIFNSNPDQGYTFAEISSTLFQGINIFEGDTLKRMRDFFYGVAMTHTLNEALQKLVKIGKINKIFAEDQTYYYFEQKK